MKSLLRTLTLLFLACRCTFTLAAQEIRIAAASDLNSVLPGIAEQFERENHCKVVVSYGSSGNFFQQLSNGAPFDIFLSADAEYPHRLQKAGFLVGDPVQYAEGQLVLWVRKALSPQPVDLKFLLTERVRKVAIANPQHAPYGKAAVSALQAAHLYDRVSAKLVLGENVSQAALFARSGAADAAILPLSLVMTPALKQAGSHSAVSRDSYPPILQVAVAMRASKQPNLAAAFLSFLASAKIQDRLREAGFITRK